MNQEEEITDLTISSVLIDSRVRELSAREIYKMLRTLRNKIDKCPKYHYPKNTISYISNGFGDCVICYEELGRNLLASTKCGHVFCLKCLERWLHTIKVCPICRSSLEEVSAYHPLYFCK